MIETGKLMSGPPFATYGNVLPRVGEGELLVVVLDEHRRFAHVVVTRECMGRAVGASAYVLDELVSVLDDADDGD